MLTRMRSFRSDGSEYQSVRITPPNGSADCNGMKDSVSSDACQRKEFTPSVTRPLVDVMAVDPVVVSGMSLSLDEPQAVSNNAERTTAGTRIISSHLTDGLAARLSPVAAYTWPKEGAQRRPDRRRTAGCALVIRA